MRISLCMDLLCWLMLFVFVWFRFGVLSQSLDLEENFLGNAGGRAITTALALIERTMAKAPVPYPIDEESVSFHAERVSLSLSLCLYM